MSTSSSTVTAERANSSRTAAVFTAPPPSASTAGFGSRRAATVAATSCLRNGRLIRPATSSPTDDLQAPKKPMSARCLFSTCNKSLVHQMTRTSLVHWSTRGSGSWFPIDALPVGAVGTEEVRERVAAELLSRRARELEGDRRLDHDGERLDRCDIASLDERLPGLARFQIDRPQRTHQRGQ